MVLHLPDEIVHSLNLTEVDMVLELAVALYASQKISFGKARQLAGLDWVRFNKILSERGIASHYGEADFVADLAAIAQFSEQ